MHGFQGCCRRRVFNASFVTHWLAWSKVNATGQEFFKVTALGFHNWHWKIQSHKQHTWQESYNGPFPPSLMFQTSDTCRKQGSWSQSFHKEASRFRAYNINIYHTCGAVCLSRHTSLLRCTLVTVVLTPAGLRKHYNQSWLVQYFRHSTALDTEHRYSDRIQEKANT